MRLRMHIKEGVERGLCGTCADSLIRTDDAGQQTVECRASYYYPEQILKPVVDCNCYQRKTDMRLSEMERKAWIIEVKKGGSVGFVKPEHRNDFPPD